MTHPFSSKLSLVTVYTDQSDFDALLKLDSQLTVWLGNIDHVVIANGVNEKTALDLVKRIHELPDATAHFLLETVESDYATLIGMDNATSDWILCLNPCEYSEEKIARLLGAYESGIDHMVLRSRRQKPHASVLYRCLSHMYVKAYHMFTGLTIDRGQHGLKLYSRAAAQYVLRSRQAEILLHSLKLGPFFPSKIIDDEQVEVIHDRQSTYRGLVKAMQVLMRTTTMPLRLAMLAAIASCIINALYSVAVLLIHAFQADVAPGWTTLSLQTSMMFFVVSLLLALIGEYLIQIERNVNYRLRYSITREIRSSKSRLEGTRNIWTITRPEPQSMKA